MDLFPKKSEKKVFNSHWLFTVYLALVSLVAVIVVSIHLGILITSLGKYIIITDEEYIVSNQSWQIRQCREMRNIEGKIEERTPEEISACEEDAIAEAVARRSINLKETFITSLAWSIVFWILFYLHYPQFLRVKEES